MTKEADAGGFLLTLDPAIPLPRVSRSEDEISLTWRTAHKEAVVSFEGGGLFGYTMLIGGKFEPGQYEGRAGDGIPADLLDYLTGISE